MPIKRVHTSQLGEVILARRRGVKNLRLSVTARGQVRVSMPYWSPYRLGLEFALSRQDWLHKQMAVHQPRPILAGAKIGRWHQVWFQTDKAAEPAKVRVKHGLISVRSARAITDPAVQKKLQHACEAVLRHEATDFLPKRTAELAHQHVFRYNDLRVRKLVARWGSCSSKNIITLSYYLMQLPDELLDYIIIHELVHTEQHNHGPAFWSRFKAILPEARSRQKQLRAHIPRLEPR